MIIVLNISRTLVLLTLLPVKSRCHKLWQQSMLHNMSIWLHLNVKLSSNGQWCNPSIATVIYLFTTFYHVIVPTNPFISQIQVLSNREGCVRTRFQCLQKYVDHLNWRRISSTCSLIRIVTKRLMIQLLTTSKIKCYDYGFVVVRFNWTINVCNQRGGVIQILSLFENLSTIAYYSKTVQ